jgi:hypothetical protein
MSHQAVLLQFMKAAHTLGAGVKTGQEGGNLCNYVNRKCEIKRQ